MHPETVSIVIPCFKGEPFLARSIESCLEQSYSHLEILVVDDCSPDRCAEIAGQFAARDSRVRLIRRSFTGGVARAFNTGYAKAQGKYFTRLAQDDLFGPGAIEHMVHCLASNPYAGLVYCDMQLIDENGEITGCFQVAQPAEALAHENRVGLCVMWRRSVWEAIGEFDPACDTAEDYEYWLRLAKRFEIVRCGGADLFFHRRHKRMGSLQFNAHQAIAGARARARHCKGFLERRRILSGGYTDAAFAERKMGHFGAAARDAMRALIYWQAKARPYRCLAGTALRFLGAARAESGPAPPPSEDT